PSWRAIWLADRAVDQGRQERGEVDEAVVPALQGQRGALAVVRSGVQPGQLPAAAGPPEAGQALEPDHAPREVDQDRGQGSPPLKVRDVSTGGSRRATEVVRPDCGTDRLAATGMRLGLRFTTPDKPFRMSSPYVRSAP